MTVAITASSLSKEYLEQGLGSYTGLWDQYYKIWIEEFLNIFICKLAVLQFPLE